MAFLTKLKNQYSKINFAAIFWGKILLHRNFDPKNIVISRILVSLKNNLIARIITIARIVISKLDCTTDTLRYTFKFGKCFR